MSFDNPVFIFLVIIAALIRWLSKKSETTTTTNDPQPPNVDDDPMMRGNETHTEEERIRRFLEALGQPAGTKPPPRIKPKRRTEPRAFPGPKLPPLKTVPPPVPVEPMATSEPPLPIIPTSFPAAPSAPAMMESAYEVRDFSRPVPTETPSARRTADQAGLLQKLRSPQDLRTAIVLREVFGPPRGLQSQGDF